jgi:hypothetical protein
MSLFATPDIVCPFGDTVRVEIKRNFALIEYKNLEDAVEAREKLHNAKLGDRMLVVGYKSRDRDRQERGWGEEERGREMQKNMKRNRESGRVRSGDAGGYRRDDKGRKDGGRDAHERHRDCYGDSRGTEKSPDLKRNIDINKQIMGAQGASELCTLIEARVAEFNHVNVATAFRTLLQSRRDGGPRGVVERADD